ncbi:MAG: M12 family metallo-peptidase [Dysgonamonadaceae bacterium]|jgi:hypothetical protein|nr:M12 family metallo-peptidase [Dysgonamonadaceae bacterium]
MNARQVIICASLFLTAVFANAQTVPLRSGQTLNVASMNEMLINDDIISISLHQNAPLKALKTASRITDSGSTFWVGNLTDGRNGVMEFLVKNGCMSGSVRDYDANKVYDISVENGGQVNIKEFDLSEPHDEECTEIEAEEEYGFRAATATATPENPALIDILVLYPSQLATASYMGSTEAARTAKIEEIIEQTNQIFINSQVYVKFRLAGHEINDVIPHNATSTSDVSGASGVSSLRNTYGADIVSHWNYDGTAGSGVVGSQSASSSAGFNTSKYSEVISRYTFAHECGHNLGSRHDRYEYFKDGGDHTILLRTPGYQFGKCFLQYRTVMAYDNSKYLPGSDGKAKSRIMHYSNPNVNYNGVPTGVAGTTPTDQIGDGGPANAARMINECAKNAESWKATKITSSNKPAASETLQVYPNPVDNELNIRNFTKGSLVKIYNSAGVLAGTYETSVISVSHLPAGVYYIRINGQTAKIVKK